MIDHDKWLEKLNERKKIYVDLHLYNITLTLTRFELDELIKIVENYTEKLN